MPISGRSSGGSLELPIPQKSLNATSISMKELKSVVAKLEREVKKVVQMEEAYAKVIHKYGYENVDPKLWSDKGGVFSKSPKQVALTMGTKAGPIRDNLLRTIAECRERLTEISADVNYITARMIAPWATEEDTSGKNAQKVLEDSMVGWTAAMKKIADKEKSKYEEQMKHFFDDVEAAQKK